MTREEVTNTLKTAISEVEWTYPLDYVVALEEAIKLINSLPPYTQQEKEEATSIKALTKYTKIIRTNEGLYLIGGMDDFDCLQLHDSLFPSLSVGSTAYLDDIINCK